ncbi:MAG: XdhC family protein [Bacteroidetes bacterium]|nr:XdhC family protein [Bacteroidota bacterium]
MKELIQLIEGYEQAKAEGQAMALATVVQVDGSAYRRPGARMLVTQEGRLTGAISGGCLEGDALRKAQTVIFQQKPMLVTYDTTDEDDQKFGIGLGCNGIIHLLIEPIDINQADHPVELIRQALAKREMSLLVTIFSLKTAKSEQFGTVYLRQGNQEFGSFQKIPSNCRAVIAQEVASFAQDKNRIHCYTELNELSVFFELISPPVRVLLFGAGNDTQPVAHLAGLLGYELHLLDGRKALATPTRFPNASKIVQGSADEIVQQLETDQHTVALLMTHNFDYELRVLEELNTRMLPYIGILGPKIKTDKLINLLEIKGIQVFRDAIFAPIGLDLGAETSEEIALSIFAEIAAVLRKKPAGFLRVKQGPIHEIGR